MNSVVVVIKIDPTLKDQGNALAKQFDYDTGGDKTFGEHCAYNATGAMADPVACYAVDVPVKLKVMPQIRDAIDELDGAELYTDKALHEVVDGLVLIGGGNDL